MSPALEFPGAFCGATFFRQSIQDGEGNEKGQQLPDEGHITFFEAHRRLQLKKKENMFKIFSIYHWRAHKASDEEPESVEGVS
jgi:hypothetical protein